MRIRNKRAFLARGLRGTGLLRLIERAARRPGLVVLCYHRVGDPAADPFYGPLVSATPEAFREQVRRLRDAFRLATLEELVEAAGEGLPLREPTALITFDDGYRDNLDLAAPILRELGAPAAFFLTTGFLDGTAVPWWDRVAVAVKRSPRPRFRIDRPEPLEVDLASLGPSAALAMVIAAFLRSRRPDDPEALAHLEDRSGSEPDPAGLRGLLLDLDGARRLAALGLSIGAHTATHPRLAGLDPAALADELSAPKARLERELGRPVAALAYPYGTPLDVDPAARRAAADAGYRLAFALEPGWNPPGATDPLSIRRLPVGPADTPTLLRARIALTAARGHSPL